MPKVETVLGFEFMQELTEQEIAATLDVEESAARELLAGGIAFESGELRELARMKGVSVNELVRVARLFEE